MTKFREHDLFRMGLSIYLLAYYARMLPELSAMYSDSGMVARNLLIPRYPSLFFLFPEHAVLVLGAAVLLVLIALFSLGRLGKAGVLALFVLQVSLHNANPLIIHEPQQLANLFLLAFVLFLPSRGGREADPFVVRTLVGFLALYYFVAGAKKLPDPLWRSGDALRYLLEWPGLARPGAVNAWIVDHAGVARAMDWGTLGFELLSPVGILWKRARPAWIVAGLVFHSMIALAMEVGTFSGIMVASYGLLLDDGTRGALLRLPPWRRLFDPPSQ